MAALSIRLAATQHFAPPTSLLCQASKSQRATEYSILRNNSDALRIPGTGVWKQRTQLEQDGCGQRRRKSIVRSSLAPAKEETAAEAVKTSVAPFNVLITGSTKEQLGGKVRKVSEPDEVLIDTLHGVINDAGRAGVGLALAQEFLRNGDNVIVCSRSEERVQSTVEELACEFGEKRVWGKACDVKDAKSIEALANLAKSELGRIDIWINNAGTNAYTYKPLVDSSDTDILEIVETNTLGVMLCCRQAIRLMRDQPRGGHIFNMDGAGADGNPTPRFAAYGATKRSLAQFTKSLQAELKMSNIRNVVVHDLSPGMVTTDLLMSGSDTRQAKFFINVLAEPADTVAKFLVPRIRAIAGDNKNKSTYTRFLTGFKAYTQILAHLMKGSHPRPLSGAVEIVRKLGGCHCKTVTLTKRLLFKARKDRYVPED